MLLTEALRVSESKNMQDLTIRSKVGDLKVKFVNDFDFVNELLNIQHYIVIAGLNVYGLYKEKIFDRFPNDKVMPIQLGEEKKTIQTVIKMYKKLSRLPAKKNLTLISFGGGVNQDVCGFVASTLYRGINWIYVPTTLLAMADSAIGLKTSLNFQSYKNLIGTFCPPSEIYINIDFLDTLKKEDYYSGVGEIIKLYLMRVGVANSLEGTIDKIHILTGREDKSKITKIIHEVMKIKLRYMQGDERDLGKRNLLNYGHEFGHAFESASNLSVPHGVAVMIGIIFANYISVKRGWLDSQTFNNINNNLLLPAISQSMVKLDNEFFDKRKILGSMRHDKKRSGDGLVLVVPWDDSFKKIQDLTGIEFEDGLSKVQKALVI